MTTASIDGRNAIIERLRLRQERETRQLQILDPVDDWKEQIGQKLSGLLDGTQYDNFARCGNEMIFRTCKNCGRFESFPYACNLKWCPRCQPKCTNVRRKMLQVWSRKINQPKHLVLTQKNFPILTRKKIRQHYERLCKIRRTKTWKTVKGGCVSVEITNEDCGWHLHSHWLIDCRWLDMEEISKTWGELCVQEFAIVKIKDARRLPYLSEVLKYVCKPADMATWPREHINEFVRAIKGMRFFFSFGSLFKLGPAIRAELAASKPEAKPCECGETDYIWQSETRAVLEDVQRASR